MKFLLSELGQCIIYGVIFLILVGGFYELLNVVTR